MVLFMTVPFLIREVHSGFVPLVRCEPLVMSQKQAFACSNCGARYWD